MMSQSAGCLHIKSITTIVLVCINCFWQYSSVMVVVIYTI